MVSVGARVKIAGILSVVKANIFRFFILIVFHCMKTQKLWTNCQREFKSKKDVRQKKYPLNRGFLQ